MTIQVKLELGFNDLMSQCWSGAVDTLNRIYDNNMEDAFMNLLNEIFETPTMTDINDYLWFQPDEIFEYLGISEDDEDEDDEEYDEDDEITKMIMTKMTKMKVKINEQNT